MCTMLVVDDEADVRDLIGQSARRHGHKVIEAADAEDAVASAQSQHPDVIAMDIHLALSDGFQVLEEMRHRGVQGYAVIVSGKTNGRTLDLNRWKELKIFDVVNKPFSVENLMTRLEAAADATRHEDRLCNFLDGIISNNESSLNARVHEDAQHGE